MEIPERALESKDESYGLEKKDEIKKIIAYPPVDFTTPFEELTPSEIDIYFHYSNEIGKNTCKANCEHCYLKTRPGFSIPMDKAKKITASLKQKGYNIGLTPADTFANDFLNQTREEGKEESTAGSAFRLEEVGLSAWTGGKQLALPGWESKLDQAYKQGYRSIVITGHDIAGTDVPIKGVTRAKDIRSAIWNITAWNSQEVVKDGFEILVTFTIGKHNLDLDYMKSMAQWCIENGVDVCRFNCFANFLGDNKLSDLEMSRADIQTFGKYLSELNLEYLNTNLKFGLSEDIGDAFVTSQLLPYLGSEWKEKGNGWCRAGYKLFAMIEVDGEIVLTGCVDAREPILGKVIFDRGSYDIERDVGAINYLRTSILKGDVYACYGGVGKQRSKDAGFEVDSFVEEKLFNT